MKLFVKLEFNKIMAHGDVDKDLPLGTYECFDFVLSVI
jgi:hypothetical protein